MKYEEFICQVQARLAEKLGDEVRAERRLIVKNNGVALEGITIMEEGKKISPVIYLKDYYVVYQKGVTLEEVTEDILKVYEKSRPGMPAKKGNKPFLIHSLNFKNPSKSGDLISRSTSLTVPQMPCHVLPHPLPSHERCHGLHPGSGLLHV